MTSAGDARNGAESVQAVDGQMLRDVATVTCIVVHIFATLQVCDILVVGIVALHCIEILQVSWLKRDSSLLRS